jgi:NADH-quinone oxidoreductase subunit A
VDRLFDALSPLNILFKGLAAFSPVLIILAIATGIGIGMLVVGWILFRPNKPTPLKQMTYECGIEPNGDAYERVIPRYYIYAMLFLAFDVEALFLFPWAIVFDRIGLFAFIEMVLFVVILLVGLFYAWAKGALDWHY